MNPVETPYTVVVPTVGRPSLTTLLESLLGQAGPALPTALVLVDDRPQPGTPLPLPDRLTHDPAPWTTIVAHGLGRGPAAARNLGAALARTPWVAFLDDDVVLPDGWGRALATDLAAAAADPRVAGTQGRIHVPLSRDRRPTDWERSTRGLEDAAWATADLAYRAEALAQVGGFDERFPRAYREDADLALRLRQAGWRLVRSDRVILHPVRPAPAHQSVRSQRGNADDALMRRLHGRRWRTAAQAGRGRFPWHVATTASAALGLVGASMATRATSARSRHSGIPRSAWGVTLSGIGAWCALTADFAARRIAPGPRDPAEVVRMAWTSIVIPPVAVWHRLAGAWRHRNAGAWPPRVDAVLFDRDGTLVHDVPYNGDPNRVEPVRDARESLGRLRANGIRVGVVSNQSGVARGLIDAEDVAAVNAEVERRLGPFDTWQVCHHGPDDGCGCRKPAPGLIRAAAREVGVPVERCVVIGDIESDVLAARAAGAAAVLVPTSVTRAEEVVRAPWVARDLREAVDLVLERARR